MSTTTAPNSTSTEKAFTRVLPKHNDETAHVLDIVNYQKNKRINALDLQSEKDESFGLDRGAFVFPELKRRPAFNHRNSFVGSENWIGHVTAISDTFFSAKIEVLDSQGGTFEETDFDLNDIEEEDMKLLRIGSIFYWSVGYEYRGGTKSKQSVLRFKRLPTLNMTEVDAALDLSTDLYEHLNWKE